MSILQFVWAGDLDENKTQRLQNPQALFQARCHPLTMIVRQDKKETRIGRKNSKMPPDYALESAVSNRMISRNHVTIERLSKGNYMLYDHSLNGTYVNYCRVIGGTILKNDDVVCFGHINGANIKPGESVTPFSTDLKYRVEIMERPPAPQQQQQYSEHFSGGSSDEETVPKVHKRSLKVSKPPSDHSSDSSDLSQGCLLQSSNNNNNNNNNNNYNNSGGGGGGNKKKKTHLSSLSSSDDDDDRQMPPIKDRSSSSIYKKSIADKSVKKHTSSGSLPTVSRHSDSSRKRKMVVTDSATTGTAGTALHKQANYQKKQHDNKRMKSELEDRRGNSNSNNKERKLHKSHLKNKYNSQDNSNIGNSKSSSSSTTKRNSGNNNNNNNVNSSYDYEECSAQPCRRPDGENIIDWIMCDKCNQWFHQFCVGLDETVEDDESYYCPYCAHK